MAKVETGFEGLPVLYFTELLTIALGESAEDMDVSRHHVDPRPVLKARGL